MDHVPVVGVFARPRVLFKFNSNDVINICILQYTLFVVVVVARAGVGA